MNVMDEVTQAFCEIERQGSRVESVVFTTEALANAMRYDAEFFRKNELCGNRATHIWGAQFTVGDLPFKHSFACFGGRRVVVGVIKNED